MKLIITDVNFWLGQKIFMVLFDMSLLNVAARITKNFVFAHISLFINKRFDGQTHSAKIPFIDR